MPQTSNGQKLYYTAKGLIGQVLCGDNAADGYGIFGCAESVNYVFKRAFGGPIGGGASTGAMLNVLETDSRFKEIPEGQQLPGDIAMCATGTSTLGPQAHGHVAIVGYTWYMSNDSETATWEANYTHDMWVQSFAARGFVTRYFRVL